MYPIGGGDPRVFKGTASATLARVEFTNSRGRRSFAMKAVFRNTGGTNALNVHIPGVDGELEFFTIATNSFLEIAGPLHLAAVAAAAATTTYEIVANVV